jgi:hypothetical protein
MKTRILMALCAIVVLFGTMALTTTPAYAIREGGCYKKVKVIPWPRKPPWPTKLPAPDRLKVFWPAPAPHK